MSIFDWWKVLEQEKKKEDLKQKVLEKEDLIDFQKLQKKIREKIKTKEELDKLKDFIASGILSRERVENILSWEILNWQEIKEILEKIEENASLDEPGKIIPKQLQISQTEYLEAVNNFEAKKKLLSKIDYSLDYIYRNMWGWWLTFSLFSFLSYSLILSKNAQKIQWNLIDMKNDILNTQTL